MPTIEAALSEVKDLVPGVNRAVMVLLPDGLQLGAFGESHAIDYEPLIRACARCFAPAVGELHLDDEPPQRFTECFALMEDGLVVMQRGRQESRIALAAVCAFEVNLALLLTWTRRAIELIESNVDFSELDLD